MKCKLCSNPKFKPDINHDFRCPRCHKKKMIGTPMPDFNRLRIIPLEEAQLKIRNVYSNYYRRGYRPSCQVQLPSCYEGKKVRVIVVGDEDAH